MTKKSPPSRKAFRSKKSAQAKPRQARRRKVKVVVMRDIGTIDRIDTMTNFAEGIGDAVRGVEVLASTNCQGVLALIESHLAALRELSADLCAAGPSPAKAVRS